MADNCCTMTGIFAEKKNKIFSRHKQGLNVQEYLIVFGAIRSNGKLYKLHSFKPNFVILCQCVALWQLVVPMLLLSRCLCQHGTNPAFYVGWEVTVSLLIVDGWTVKYLFEKNDMQTRTATKTKTPHVNVGKTIKANA